MDKHNNQRYVQRAREKKEKRADCEAHVLRGAVWDLGQLNTESIRKERSNLMIKLGRLQKKGTYLSTLIQNRGLREKSQRVLFFTTKIRRREIILKRVHRLGKPSSAAKKGEGVGWLWKKKIDSQESPQKTDFF